MRYFIKRVSYHLPERRITNKYLQEVVGISSEFLEDKIGIKERRAADENESCSEMAALAAQKALAEEGLRAEDISLVVLCTQSPDYRLPTTACLVQKTLGLPTTVMAFDINLGCSGYVYGLFVAGSCLEKIGRGNALLLTVDQYTKLIDKTDKNTVSIFGDAASATILALTENSGGAIDQDFGTDGSGAMHLVAPNSGTVRDPAKSSFLFMNGREVFKFTVTAVPKSVQTILTRNHLDKNDVSLYIFHQANKYIIKEIQKILKIEDSKIVIDMEDIGNTVSSSIPIALSRAIDSGRCKKDDLIILCGFGVGLSWGTILYRI